MSRVIALAGPPSVYSPRPSQVALAHLSTIPTPQQVRERRGLRSLSARFGVTIGEHFEDQILTSEMRLQAWRRCSDVRAAIDAHVRVISTWDWLVEPAVEADDPRYDQAVEIASQVYSFLSAPNDNGETWQDLCSLAVRDLLIDDALAMEKVRNGRGQLVEVVAIPGGSIIPRRSPTNRLLGYRQFEVEGPSFKPDDLLYMNLFGCTSRIGGNPLMDALVVEIMALMQSNEHIMHAFSSDEIPPGIAVIGGLAKKAAERAIDEIRNAAGNDKRLHVLASENPQGIEAKWIEFRKTMKEMDLANVVHEVRRTIWRVFGVKPVTMGDTEATPRATAEVQVSAEDSDMTRPILEGLAAKVNMDLVPAIVGDDELASLVRFCFDLEADESAEEYAARQTAAATQMDHGVLTLNEWRAANGRPSLGEAGDVPLLKQGNLYVPLDAVLGLGEYEEEEEEEEENLTDEEGQDDEDQGAVDEDEARSRTRQLKRRSRERIIVRAQPVHGPRRRFRYSLLGPTSRQVVRRNQIRDDQQHECGPSCLHGRARPMLRADGLPSDWQPNGRFEGYRTLDLRDLGGAIIEYRRRVAPSYRDTRSEIVGEFVSVLEDGKLSERERQRLITAIQAHLDSLAANWSMLTEDLYIDVAEQGDRAVKRFSGYSPSTSARDFGLRAHSQAMNYLTAHDGLVGQLRAELTELVLQLQAGLAARTTDDLAAEASAAAGAIIDRNEHRIDNWGGRLVLYGNERVMEGLQETGTVVDTDGGQPKTAEWMAEWVSVGDKVMCATCEREGLAGFRPLSALPTVPGGATECRARCRCVLVFWTRDEVNNGTAESLTNTSA